MIKTITKAISQTQRNLALSCFALGIWNSIHCVVYKNQIHPFTHFGWQFEQWSLNLFLILVGLYLSVNSITLKDSTDIDPFLFFLLFGIELIFWTIYYRYFWLSFAAVGILFLAQTTLMSAHNHLRQRSVWSFSVLALVSTSLLLSLIYVSAGLFLVGN